MSDKDSPYYPHNPIASIDSLLLALGVTEIDLHRAAGNADSLYKEKPQKKKDGSLRMTYDAKRPLKPIQKRIVSRILRSVRFPLYLHGGIRDKEHPRHPLSNVIPHAGSYEYVLLDIKDFYPSVGEREVFDIWCNFFCFSPEVAEILTRLTIKDGCLPQGACTSGYLANLVFWDIELDIVNRLKTAGIIYSRFADDITISSPTRLSASQRTEIFSMVMDMLAKKGLKQKRSKTQIRLKGQPIKITGLTTNGRYPTLPKRERKRIRAAVAEVERELSEKGSTAEVMKKYHSAMSRVGRLNSVKHPEGVRLRERLNKCAENILN